tara:strand:+ start:5680 stop:6837 length:1158 start_codon:yes stop_codon:yes gene_type:complete
MARMRKKFSEEIKKRTPKQEKNIAKQKLERIIRQKDKGLSTTGVDPKTSWGKRTGKYDDVRDKYLEGGWDALTEGEKTKAAFYLGLDGAGSVPTPYGGEMDRFKKTSPLYKQVYKERFPHPLSQIVGALGDAYKTFSPMARIVSGFKKAETGAKAITDSITNALGISSTDEAKPFIYEGAIPAYNPLGLEEYQDRIMRLQTQNIDDSQEEEVTEINDTNIETIKSEKQNNKIFNNPEVLADVANFNKAIKNPGIVNALPPNFEKTLNILKNTGNLASGDYLRANQLLNNIISQNTLNPNLSTGIVPILPQEFEVAENTFTPILDNMGNTIKNFGAKLSDDKGLDIGINDRSLQYSRPLFGGNIEGSISGIGTENPTAGLFFNKLI